MKNLNRFCLLFFSIQLCFAKDDNNFTHQSTLQTTNVNEKGYQRTDTQLGKTAQLRVKGDSQGQGRLNIQAKNINVAGATISNEGKSQTVLSAKNNLNLTALTTSSEEKMGGGKHARQESIQQAEVSRVSGKGDVLLNAKNLTAEGAELSAGERLVAIAKHNLTLGTASERQDYAEYHQTKSRGAFSSKTKMTYNSRNATMHRGVEATGKSILFEAGNDLIGTSLLAVAKAGFEAMNVVDSLSNVTEGLATGTATGGAVGVSITCGQQKSVQTQHSKGNIAEKSEINAGGKVNIRTTGVGKNAMLTLKGARWG